MQRFKFLQILLGGKNATSVCSENISTLLQWLHLFCQLLRWKLASTSIFLQKKGFSNKDSNLAPNVLGKQFSHPQTQFWAEEGVVREALWSRYTLLQKYALFVMRPCFFLKLFTQSIFYDIKVQLFWKGSQKFVQSSSWFWHLLSKHQNHEKDCEKFYGLLINAELYIVLNLRHRDWLLL